MFKLRALPLPKDCLDDPLPTRKYTLIPEYHPVKAVMVSENLDRRNGGNLLIPALLQQGIEVWYLASTIDAFTQYQQSLSAKLTQEQLAKLRDLRITTRSSWTRDWAPLFASIQPPPTELKLVDARYVRDEQVHFDDGMPSQLKFELKNQKLLPSNVVITKTFLPLILEGGNLMCNSKVCFVSEKVALDNPEHMQKVTKEFKKLFTQSLELVELMPREPNGHMDLWAKFLKDDLLAIADVMPSTLTLVPPEAFEIYQQMQTFLNTQATGYDKTGAPVLGSLALMLKKLDPKVKIVRVPMPLPMELNGIAFFRSYINSLLVNGKAILPRFERLTLSDGDKAYPDEKMLASYERDAERVYAEAGYQVVWVNADPLVPYGGTWHCVAAQVPSF